MEVDLNVVVFVVGRGVVGIWSGGGGGFEWGGCNEEAEYDVCGGGIVKEY